MLMIFVHILLIEMRTRGVTVISKSDPKPFHLINYNASFLNFFTFSARNNLSQLHIASY